jgi:hypothetical protein
MKVQKRTNCAFGLLGSGNWQVATPNINGGTTNVGAYHSSSTYYLQGTPNTAVGYATAEL